MSFRHFGPNSSISECELQDSKTGRHPPNPNPGRNFAVAKWVQEWVLPESHNAMFLLLRRSPRIYQQWKDRIPQTWNTNHRMQKNRAEWTHLTQSPERRRRNQALKWSVQEFWHSGEYSSIFKMKITGCTNRVEPTWSKKQSKTIRKRANDEPRSEFPPDLTTQKNL